MYKRRRISEDDDGGELKYFDQDVSIADVNAGGAIPLSTLNAIAQGVGESQRIGRRVVIKKIIWRWSLRLLQNSTAGNAYSIVRLMLYLDKQANGAVATATDILEDNDVYAFNKLSSKDRYTILFDKLVTLSPQGGALETVTVTVPLIKAGILSRTCEIPIEFSSTTGAITEIKSNNLGCLIVGLNSSSTVELDGRVRLRYTE